jgi:hypothetical protein
LAVVNTVTAVAVTAEAAAIGHGVATFHHTQRSVLSTAILGTSSSKALPIGPPPTSLSISPCHHAFRTEYHSTFQLLEHAVRNVAYLRRQSRPFIPW